MPFSSRYCVPMSIVVCWFFCVPHPFFSFLVDFVPTGKISVKHGPKKEKMQFVHINNIPHINGRVPLKYMYDSGELTAKKGFGEQKPKAKGEGKWLAG